MKWITDIWADWVAEVSAKFQAAFFGKAWLAAGLACRHKPGFGALTHVICSSFHWLAEAVVTIGMDRRTEPVDRRQISLH